MWKSDGTEAGTVSVLDISSDVSELTAVGDTLFFSARNETSGRELWKSDGTSTGTVLIADIYPGISSDGYSGYGGYGGYGGNGGYSGDSVEPNSSDPSDLIAVGDTLFFTADDGSGRKLWRSDGTEAGTVLFSDIEPNIHEGYYGDYPSSYFLAAVDDTLYFVADADNSGEELWKTDGTNTGTVRVSDINPGEAGSNPSRLTVVGDTLFFSATDGSSGDELWALDLKPERPTASFALTTSTVKKTEGNSGDKRFKFTVTRTGDLSEVSSAAWAVSGIGKNAADSNDFYKGILPSGTVRFLTGQSKRTIKIRVEGDRVQELNEKFRVTLSDPIGGTVTTATATGVIRNDDLTGTSASETISGTRQAEFINGFAGQDILTGGSGGANRYGFRYRQSRINSPDHITDFRPDKDKISLINKKGEFLSPPKGFSRADDNSTAATFKELVNAVFVDADPLTTGNQALAAKSAALVQSTNKEIAGTYLLINDGNARLSLKKDLLINITGFSGSLPDLGTVPVDSVFN